MSDIIEQIPSIMIYVIPGFIGITAFRLLMDVRINTTTVWVNSAVWSLVSILLLRCTIVTNWTQWSLCLASILVCGICGIIVAMICRSQKCAEYLRLKFGIGVYDSVIHDAIDYEHGSVAVIVLKNNSGEYRGHVLAVSGTQSAQQWISIEDPCYFDADGQLVWESAAVADGNENYLYRMAFPLNEIESIMFVSKTTKSV